jgi:hypothetical protein
VDSHYFVYSYLCGNYWGSPTPKDELSTQKQQDSIEIEPLLPAKPQGKPFFIKCLLDFFGNTNTTNKPWITIEDIEDIEVDKFSDFTDIALQGIKELGTIHIGFTGVLHHDVITYYSA